MREHIRTTPVVPLAADDRQDPHPGIDSVLNGTETSPECDTENGTREGSARAFFEEATKRPDVDEIMRRLANS